MLLSGQHHRFYNTPGSSHRCSEQIACSYSPNSAYLSQSRTLAYLPYPLPVKISNQRPQDDNSLARMMRRSPPSKIQSQPQQHTHFSRQVLSSTPSTNKNYSTRHTYLGSGNHNSLYALDNVLLSSDLTRPLKPAFTVAPTRPSRSGQH